LQCRWNEERERDQVKQHQQEQQRLLKESNRIAEQAASDARREEFRRNQKPGRMIRGLGGGHDIFMEELLEAQREREEYAEALFMQRLAHAKTDEQMIDDCLNYFKKCASEKKEGSGFINISGMDPRQKKDQSALVFYFDFDPETSIGINVISESKSADVQLVKINKLLESSGLSRRFETDEFGFCLFDIPVTETESLKKYLPIAFKLFRNLEGDSFSLWDPTDYTFDYSGGQQLKDCLKSTCLDFDESITYLENKFREYSSGKAIPNHVYLFNFFGYDSIQELYDNVAINVTALAERSFSGAVGIPRLSIQTGKKFRIELSVFGKFQNASSVSKIFFNSDRKAQLTSHLEKLNSDLTAMSDNHGDRRFRLRNQIIFIYASDPLDTIAIAKLLMRHANELNEYKGVSDLWYPISGDGSVDDYDNFRFTITSFKKWKRIKQIFFATVALGLIVNPLLFMILIGAGFSYWYYKESKKY
jgi:hypothetical protein